MTGIAEAVGDIPFERDRENQAWARWIARLGDSVLLTPFVFALFFVLGVLVELGRAPPVLLDWFEDPIMSSVLELAIVFVLFALWEPLFLSNAGTTPGKWIMGISVRRPNGAKLSFFRALNRFVRVWFVGMGASIPILALILMVASRGHLVTHGVTMWDDKLDCKVEHRKRHPIVWFLMIVIVLGVSIGLQLLSRLQA